MCALGTTRELATWSPEGLPSPEPREEGAVLGPAARGGQLGRDARGAAERERERAAEEARAAMASLPSGECTGTVGVQE